MTMKMKAAVFVEPGRIALEENPIPDAGANDALIRITTTTICGTDVHILKGEYPVAKRLTVGHEPGRCDREAGAQCARLRGRPAGDRGRDLPQRLLQCLPRWFALAGRPRLTPRTETDGRLALR